MTKSLRYIFDFKKLDRLSTVLNVILYLLLNMIFVEKNEIRKIVLFGWILLFSWIYLKRKSTKNIVIPHIITITKKQLKDTKLVYSHSKLPSIPHLNRNL